MTRSISLIFLAGLFLWVTPAIALDEYGSYFGFDYMLTQIDDDYADTVDLDVIAGKFGSYLSPSTALEARLGFSASDEDADGSNYELDNFVGLYVRGILPYQTVELYGIAGVTRAELEVSGARPADGEEVSFSYGAGVDFLIGERLSIGMEYMLLIDSTDYDLTTINIGGKYYF